MNTPILFLVFNRPDTTKRVFQKIREAQPPKLYVAADGPREERVGEADKCGQVRHIATNVDWDCEVKTLLQEENIGCGPGPVTGISWFFENEEYGIILEDDCIPSDSFFPFCEKILERYKSDDRIMHINGNNYGAQNSNFSQSNYSYHLGRMPQAWGWASWRRAWKKFQWRLENYQNFKEIDYLENVFFKKIHIKKQIKRWELVQNGKRDIWDFQWQYAVISNHGLTVVPKKNLISNIGFGENATHTKSNNSSKAAIKAEEIEMPLSHPDIIVPDQKIDFWYQENMLGPSSIFKRVKNKASALVRKIK
jgi:hypothetical protein